MKYKTEIEKIKEKIIPLLKENKVTKAGIFGSYARGEQTKKSDVDILVEIDDEIGLFEFIGIKILLEKKLKRKVDLVEYECIRKELKKRILSEEIPIIR
ncbi:hypothetical protein COU60_04790 [Candidatus Pacearchaeota archaeon CG10_big_fil_rev_8_21_14_0_10_34_76]|nr:MAG: hypothetical protein COU60_04790 [Candidatus Pacearchaeota archaeon CG10_big_fil_rev_8_21_14_0_10_34_76]